MSSFTGALILRDNEDGETFTLVEHMRYYIGEEGSHTFKDLLPGFVTDLASKPWPIRRTGPENRAAVLHDGLYADPFVTRVIGDSHYQVELTRKSCDLIFREALKVCFLPHPEAVSLWRRAQVYARIEIYYRAVRAVGWRYWAHG